MKHWLIDIAVGGFLGFLIVTFTVGWFIEDKGPALLAGIILGIVAARVRRRRSVAVDRPEDRVGDDLLQP